MAKLHHINTPFVFLTFVVHNRAHVFTNEKSCDVLKNNFLFYKKKYDLLIPGFVVMPDHLQFIIGLRSKTDLPRFVHDFKSFTAQQLNHLLNSKEKFWQKDYWDHGIRNESDFIEKLNYIHKNPLELVTNLEQWPYSSYHNYYCKHEPWMQIDRIA